MSSIGGSVEDASDDDFCESEAIVVDVDQLEKAAGLKRLTRKKGKASPKASPKAKKKILADGPPRPRRRAKVVSKDLFDSEAVIDDSDDTQ